LLNNEKCGLYCLIFPNGKRYIGYTFKGGFETRFHDHFKDAYTRQKTKNYLKSKAIRKYGWDNIEKKILLISDNLEYCKKMEMDLIKAWKTNDIKFGYNSTSGGDGCNCLKHSEETRVKMRDAKLKSPNRYWLGKNRSSDTINKIKIKKNNIYLIKNLITNNEFIIYNAKEFCIKNKINYKSLLYYKKAKDIVLLHKYKNTPTIHIKEIYFGRI
jgi:group I intron endonuclease